MSKSCCGGHKHFEGKSAYEHVKEAREKTRNKLGENHGIECPGPLMSGLDAAKESALFFSILFLVGLNLSTMAIAGCGWLIWKTCRGAYLAWARLQKLHRVIEEERYEITHHRSQEKEELIELYQLKGFSGDLLEQVVDTLMADDNRLLSVMLEEELGLRLHSYEHPVVQGFGSFLGVLISSLIMLVGYLFVPHGLLIGAGLVMGIGAYWSAHLNQNSKMPMVVWNLAYLFLACACTYFVKRFES